MTSKMVGHIQRSCCSTVICPEIELGRPQSVPTRLGPEPRPTLGSPLVSPTVAGWCVRPIDAIMRQGRLIVRQSHSIMVVSHRNKPKRGITSEKACSRRRPATRGPRRPGSGHEFEPDQPSSSGPFGHGRNGRPAPAIQSDQHPADQHQHLREHRRRQHTECAALTARKRPLVSQ
jgi:hypothetical protein